MDTSNEYEKTGEKWRRKNNNGKLEKIARFFKKYFIVLLKYYNFLGFWRKK